MDSKAIVFILLNFLLSAINTKALSKDDEIEVKLQFLEYELEDFCVEKNEAKWQFLNGSDADFKKLLYTEMKEAAFYKTELELLQKGIGNINNERLRRHFDVFSHMGAALLGNTEFREYKDYSLKLEEMIAVTEIENPYKSNNTQQKDSSHSEKWGLLDKLNYNQINHILFSKKISADNLKTVWISWFEEIAKRNKETKYDFVQQLSILDLEAEQNGEEELSDYWLKMSDVTWVNYKSAEGLWEEMKPLYNKLKQFMISLVIQNFGTDALADKKLIPTHVLGSLQSWDWVTAAENLDAFIHMDAYQNIMSVLSDKNIKELYIVADNITMDFGKLPKSFYEQSRFNESSRHCQNKLGDYCKREHVMRVMACYDDNRKLMDFLRAIENTMRIKYMLLCGREEEENGFLLREGPRHSVLYEAMESFASMQALFPQNFKNLKLYKQESENKQNLLSLIINALHIIVPLPYYLASDLWRINALREIDSAVTENEEETTNLPSVSPAQNENNLNLSDSYDTKSYGASNLTADWWNYRNRFQGISSPDGNPYEDYLQDPNIIWNKPFISKFLGRLLQFQILESLESGNLTNQKLTVLLSLMRKGKSKSWQILVEEAFNITEISVKPLLQYFKPLEEFLDKAIKFKNKTQIFNVNDLNFMSQSYSSRNITREGEQHSEGSDTLYFSFIVIAAVGVVAVIVTIGRKRYRKRQRGIDRKRRMANL